MVVAVKIDNLVEFRLHNITEQIVALSVSKADHIPVHVIDVDPSFVVGVTVEHVQRPIAETRFWIGFPADPLRAIVVAVFSAIASAVVIVVVSHQLLVGWCGGVNTGYAPRRRIGRSGPLLPSALMTAGAMIVLLATVLILIRIAPLLPVVLAVTVAPTSARSISVFLAVGMTLVAARGPRLVGSRQRTTPSIVFLLYFSLDIIIVALLFVVVQRRDFEGYIAGTDLVVVVTIAVAVAVAKVAAAVRFSW